MVETRNNWTGAAEEAKTQALSHKEVHMSLPHLSQGQTTQIAQAIQFEGDTVSHLISFLI